MACLSPTRYLWSCPPIFRGIMVPIQMATARVSDLPSRLAANPLLKAEVQQEGLVMHDYTPSDGCKEGNLGDRVGGVA